MSKVYGRIGDYVPVRETYSQVIISYEPSAEPDGVHATWYEVYFNKKLTGVPSLAKIKEAITSDINGQTDEKILTGLVWRGKSVWLSRENQFNFKSEYDRALQTHGENLPLVFKIGESNGDAVYHTFETIEELDDLCTTISDYIYAAIREGWRRKDSIDWTIYGE